MSSAKNLTPVQPVREAIRRHRRDAPPAVAFQSGQEDRTGEEERPLPPYTGCASFQFQFLVELPKPLPAPAPVMVPVHPAFMPPQIAMMHMMAMHYRFRQMSTASNT